MRMNPISRDVLHFEGWYISRWRNLLDIALLLSKRTLGSTMVEALLTRRVVTGIPICEFELPMKSGQRNGLTDSALR